MKRFLSIAQWAIIAALVVACWHNDARAEGWGDLKVQFVYDGKAPVPGPVAVTKDQQFCGKFGLKDESLVVNPENGGIANVVGFLYVSRTDKVKPTIHPDYQKETEKQIVLDNKQCRFDPHITVIWTARTVELANTDEVGHNVNIATFNLANPALNQLIPAGKSMTHKFNAEENVPIPVACNIHPWMKGYLVVRDTPYAAVSDKDGNLTIAKLPAGKWKIRFWQEKAGYVQDVTVGGKATTWRRGEVEVEIKDGAVTDLGTVKVAPKAFEK